MLRIAYGVGLAALVLLVPLAGCGSLATPAGEGTPTRTVTPVPLPQDPPTPHGPAVLAPGLSPDGVFDAARLAEAHASVLSNTSFTAVREERRRYANGSLRSSYRRIVRVSPGGERFDYELNQTDVRGGRATEGRLARYSNGSTVYVATTRAGETTYSILGGQPEPAGLSAVLPQRATARSGIARLFGTLRFDVVDRRTLDGRAVYRLTVQNGTRDLDWLRDVSMNAAVREDGLVAGYRLAYDVEGIEVTVVVEFRDLGATSVTPPAWLPTARNATGTGTPTSATSAPPPGIDTGAGTATGTPTAGAPVVTAEPGAIDPDVSPRRVRGPGASVAVSSRSSSAGARP